MKKQISLLLAAIISATAFSQNVGIGTTSPNASAQLDVSSTSKGILIPRMNMSQRDAITIPATGLLIFQTDNTPGFYFYNGTVWTPILGSGSSAGWSLTGNSGTDSLTNFVGTTDNKPLVFKINNTRAGFLGNNGNVFWGKGSGSGSGNAGSYSNIGIGIDALKNNTNHSNLVAIGDSALFNNGVGAISPPEGRYNTAIGSKALFSNTIGFSNTANGYNALFSNTTGRNNTATSYGALFSNTTGYENTANGNYALFSNTTGSDNTANGYGALYSNTGGNQNTATGYYALSSNTTGSYNSANGNFTLYLNTTGNDNTANGNSALYFNKTGNDNTANGYGALFSNTTGSNNTATGYEALFSNTTGYSNIGIGIDALKNNTTRSNLVAIGDSALFNNGVGATFLIDGNYNTAIGSKALFNNTTGYDNTANGFQALYSNTTGIVNTANGANALYSNTTGVDNTAIGFYSLVSNNTGNDNTAIGGSALFYNTTGNDNTAIGIDALFWNQTGSNNIAIGVNSGTAQGSPNIQNTISIGNDTYLNAADNQAFIGNLSTGWIGGNVNWSTFSDKRIKTNIRENVKGLDFIMKLRPVTYYRSIKTAAQLTGNKETPDYSSKYDIEKILQSGFLAQDVEQAAKASGYNFSGVHVPKNKSQLYSLSYAEFVVPLVKAVQEQQAIIENLKKQVEQSEIPAIVGKQQEMISGLKDEIQLLKEQIKIMKEK